MAVKDTSLDSSSFSSQSSTTRVNVPSRSVSVQANNPQQFYSYAETWHMNISTLSALLAETPEQDVLAGTIMIAEGKAFKIWDKKTVPAGSLYVLFDTVPAGTNMATLIYAGRVVISALQVTTEEWTAQMSDFSNMLDVFLTHSQIRPEYSLENIGVF